MTPWAAQTNHHLLFYAREGYPKRLCEIKNAPLLLFASGDISLLNEPQIAMVGSRQPTGSGLRNARLFSQSLSRSGFVITSGLAAGIDSCAPLYEETVRFPLVSMYRIVPVDF